MQLSLAKPSCVWPPWTFLSVYSLSLKGFFCANYCTLQASHWSPSYFFFSRVLFRLLSQMEKELQSHLDHIWITLGSHRRCSTLSHSDLSHPLTTNRPGLPLPLWPWVLHAPPCLFYFSYTVSQASQVNPYFMPFELSLPSAWGNLYQQMVTEFLLCTRDLIFQQDKVSILRELSNMGRTQKRNQSLLVVRPDNSRG